MAKIIERVRFGKRGEGCLVRYDDSANWLSVYSHNGREHRETTRESDLKKAKKVHKDLLDSLGAERQGKGQHVPASKRKTTVGELLDAYEADIARRELKSAANQKFHVKPVREAFGDWKATDLAAADIDKIVDGWKKGTANATINRRLQVLLAAYTLASRKNVVSAVPYVKRLPERNVRQGFFEQDEFAAVLKHLPEHLQDAARFGYLTGWRRGEIVALKWSAVDLKHGTITLPDSKNGKARTIALSRELLALLKRREQARPVERPDGTVVVSDHVFHRQGQPLKCFKESWHAALAAAGFVAKKDGRVVYLKRFHDLRRTAARNLVVSGVREGAAMAITGHKTRAIFDRYAIVAPKETREALEKVTVSV